MRKRLLFLLLSEIRAHSELRIIAVLLLESCLGVLFRHAGALAPVLSPLEILFKARMNSVRLGAPCLIPKPDTRKGEDMQGSVASGMGSLLDERLAAVDIVRCSGVGCVRH